MCSQADAKTTGYPSIDKPWLKYYADDKKTFVVPDCSVYDYMLKSNEDHLSSVSLEYFGKKITYRELINRIDQCADAFIKLGIRRGDIVSFCNPTTPEIYYAFYALNKIGAVANMIDPRTNVSKIDEFITGAKSKIVFYIDIAYVKIKDILKKAEIEKAICVSPADSLPPVLKLGYRLTNHLPDDKKAPAEDKYLSWKQFFTLGQKNIREKKQEIGIQGPAGDLPAGIVYTSGTTGIPKGAVLSNKNLLSMVQQNICADMGWEKNDRFLGIMPPFIAYGLVCGFTLPICLGMDITIIPKFEAEKFDSYLLKYKPHHLMGVPSHMEKLMSSQKLKDADLGFIKTVIVGGDKLNPEMEIKINEFLHAHNSKCNVIKGYGLTEMSSNAVFPRNQESNKIGSVGTPLANNNIKVIDSDTGEELGYNEIGEICLTGPTLIAGYLNNEAENKKVFKTEQGVRWMHTGDSGYVDEDGVVFFCDRLKRMIVRHDGFKVYPAKIEKVIQSVPGIKDCCVVGTPDKGHSHGELPVAFIVLQNGTATDVDALKEAVKSTCTGSLPEYSQPAEIRICNDLPLTDVGKVDYRALEKAALDIA